MVWVAMQTCVRRPAPRHMYGLDTEVARNRAAQAPGNGGWAEPPREHSALRDTPSPKVSSRRIAGLPLTLCRAPGPHCTASPSYSCPAQLPAASSITGHTHTTNPRASRAVPNCRVSVATLTPQATSCPTAYALGGVQSSLHKLRFYSATGGSQSRAGCLTHTAQPGTFAPLNKCLLKCAYRHTSICAATAACHRESLPRTCCTAWLTFCAMAACSSEPAKVSSLSCASSNVALASATCPSASSASIFRIFACTHRLPVRTTCLCGITDYPPILYSNDVREAPTCGAGAFVSEWCQMSPDASVTSL